MVRTIKNFTITKRFGNIDYIELTDDFSNEEIEKGSYEIKRICFLRLSLFVLLNGYLDLNFFGITNFVAEA